MEFEASNFMVNIIKEHEYSIKLNYKLVFGGISREPIILD
jgi:hypothetical protein